MPEAVVLVAPPDGRILLYNAAAVRLFGTMDTAGPLSDLSTRLLTAEAEQPDPLTLPHMVALRVRRGDRSVELLVRLGMGVNADSGQRRAVARALTAKSPPWWSSSGYSALEEGHAFAMNSSSSRTSCARR